MKIVPFLILPAFSKKQLPPKMIGAYVNGCDDVTNEYEDIINSIDDGLNTIFWFSCQLMCKDDRPTVQIENIQVGEFSVLENPSCIRRVQQNTPDDFVHMLTIGSWGSSLPICSTPEKWNSTFVEWLLQFEEENGLRFDGIDWDPEGVDEPNEFNQNVMTQQALDNILQISRGVHDLDRLVSLVPAESYFDARSSEFSYQLDVKPADDWQSWFTHTGRNTYTWLYQMEPEIFDMVIIQLYEGWARANYHVVLKEEVTAIEYMRETLQIFNDGHYIDFSVDSATGNMTNTGLRNTSITVPAEKIYFGLANGWAARPTREELEKSLQTDISVDWERANFGKQILISPEKELKDIYKNELQPAGFVYWVRVEEHKTTKYLQEDYEICMACELKSITPSSSNAVKIMITVLLASILT